jgi:hypothetical protein
MISHNSAKKTADMQFFCVRGHFLHQKTAQTHEFNEPSYFALLHNNTKLIIIIHHEIGGKIC